MKKLFAFLLAAVIPAMVLSARSWVSAKPRSGPANSMGKGIVISAILLAVAGSAWGQDTVRTVKNEVFVTKVKKIGDKMIKVEKGDGYTVPSENLPPVYVSSITFQDGFTLRFQDGKIDRTGLTDAPQKVRDHHFYAEGLVKMNREEARAILGSEKKNIVFDKAALQSMIGYVQIGAGALMTLYTQLYDDRNILFSNKNHSIVLKRHGIQRAGPVSSYDVNIFTGTISTRFILCDFLGLVTLWMGTANAISANRQVKRLMDSEITLPSTQYLTRRKWLGAGAALAGAAALIGGTVDVANNESWNWKVYYKYEDYDALHGSRDGHWPVVGPYLMVAGALLANWGVTEYMVSSSMLKGAGNRPGELSFGPAPNGYGLLLKF